MWTTNPCKNCITLSICKHRVNSVYGNIDVILKCKLAENLCDRDKNGLLIVSGKRISKLIRFLKYGD